MRCFSKITWEESHFTEGAERNQYCICIYQGKGKSTMWGSLKAEVQTPEQIRYVIDYFRKDVPCWKLLHLKVHPIFKSEWRKGLR